MNRKLLACGMAFLMAGVLMADAPEKKKKGKKGGGNPAMQVIKQLETASIELTDEQKETIKTKGAELKGKMDAISTEHELTKELMAKVNEAKKTVRESGKKGKEIDTAAYAEAGLNESQIEGMNEIAAVRKAMMQEVVGMLTDEQKENLPKSLQRMLGGKKGKKKSE